MPNRPTFDL